MAAVRLALIAGAAIEDAMFSFLRKSAHKPTPQALAAEGRFAEALAAGLEAWQAEPSPKLERDLALWRNEAYFEMQHGAGRTDWLPRLPDPFPELVDRIPEIAPSQLNAATMGGGILHHGSIIVRGLISQAEAASLRDDMDQVFAARAAGLAEDESQSWYGLLKPSRDEGMSGSRSFWTEAAVLMADSPRLLARWAELLKTTGALAAVTDYLGERPVLSAKKTTLYRAPPDLGPEWHQDGAFLGDDVRTVNLWVALSDCGVDAPGLEIVPWRLNEVVQTGTHAASFDWTVGHGKVAEVASGRPIANPQFRAGDAIFFDQLCLHRTGALPGMTKTRYAIESWMFAPSHYRYGTPLVV